MPNRDLELSILYEIASISKSLHSLDEIVERVLDKAVRLIGAEVAVFYMHRLDEHHLSAYAARGVRLKHVCATIPLDGMGTKMATCTLAWTPGEQLPFPTQPLPDSYPVQSALGVPIHNETSLLGWLYVARMKPPAFSYSTITLYNVLADQIVNSLELTIAWERELQQQQALREANQRLERMLAEMTETNQRQERLLQTISELSTPVLSVAQGTLLIPLIGTIDHHRSLQINQTMLNAACHHQARVVILDITAISLVDEQVTSMLVEATQALRLLGTDVIVCGIQPKVAQMMIELECDLFMQTTNSLQNALVLAMQMQQRGLRASRVK